LIVSRQLIPGLDEGVRPVLLELQAQRVGVNPGVLMCLEDLLAVAAVGRQRLSDLAVIRESVQGLVGHGVDRVGAANASM